MKDEMYYLCTKFLHDILTVGPKGSPGTAEEAAQRWESHGELY